MGKEDLLRFRVFRGAKEGSGIRGVCPPLKGCVWPHTSYLSSVFALLSWIMMSRTEPAMPAAKV